MRSQTKNGLCKVDLNVRWDNLENGFAADRYNGNARIVRAWCPDLTDLGRGVLFLPAKQRSGVVVTAVHGTNHRRDGATKWADRGTGSLALRMAEITGCAALVALRTSGDANHDPDHPIKDTLLTLRNAGIETVVDVHGSAHLPDSPDIDLGTSAGYVPTRFVEALTDQQHLRVTVNAARAATSPRRITSFAQAHGMTAVQLEIDALLRPPTGSVGGREQLVAVLTEAICAQEPARPGARSASRGGWGRLRSDE